MFCSQAEPAKIVEPPKVKEDPIVREVKKELGIENRKETIKGKFHPSEEEVQHRLTKLEKAKIENRLYQEKRYINEYFEKQFI